MTDDRRARWRQVVADGEVEVAFTWPDGLLLRLRRGDGQVTFSAAYAAESEVGMALRAPSSLRAFYDYLDLCVARFREVTGHAGTVDVLGQTADGAQHWRALEVYGG